MMTPQEFSWQIWEILAGGEVVLWSLHSLGKSSTPSSPLGDITHTHKHHHHSFSAVFDAHQDW